MYRTYRTTNYTIFGEETENDDTKLKLITDMEGKKYVMVKENAIYDLSLVGYITEIVHDVLFEEFREFTYARLDKELIEQGIKPRRRLS